MVSLLPSLPIIELLLEFARKFLVEQEGRMATRNK
jgi:hypothetical protein